MKRLILCWASVAVVGLVTSGLSTAPAFAQGTSCDATVRATPGEDQIQDKFVYKVFGVEISTPEACAKVYVDLVTTERLFDGEEITTTSRGYRKVSTHTTYAVKYQIARDSTLTDWKFTVNRCVICGTEER